MCNTIQECVVVNNIIGSFIKQQPIIEKLYTFCDYSIRELYAVALNKSAFDFRKFVRLINLYCAFLTVL